MTYKQQYAPRQAQFDAISGKRAGNKVNVIELLMIAASAAISLTLFWPLAWLS